jgi:GH15 family glucan-1,4-alpha-glucosidase
LSLGLTTKLPLKEDGQGGVNAEFILREDQSATFLLEQIPPESRCVDLVEEAEAERLFENTVRYWRGWVSKCTYKGRWREVVHRSALVLKLLTYEPTGAIVAAPTCSLTLVAGETGTTVTRGFVMLRLHFTR